MTTRRTLLVLWDIDHTLLAIDGSGRLLYERAFHRVTGRRLAALADMSGRTDRAILAETLELNGVAVPADLGGFYAAIGDAATELADDLARAGRALPGAAAAIAALAGDGAVQSVVTGNLPAVAAAKLAAVGLGDGLDLAVGGYGDESVDRADLVRAAEARARARYGLDGPRTVVVGDTPHDVAGAHEAGAVAVAVATGRSDAAALRAAGADTVLLDLADLAAVRAAIAGPVTSSPGPRG